MAMSTSAQVTEVKSQRVSQLSVGTIGTSMDFGQHGCPEVAAVAAARAPEENMNARLPQALQQIQHDLAELSKTGRNLRRQIRLAVRDYDAGRETTVFDLRCNREHCGYPTLMLQSKCD